MKKICVYRYSIKDLENISSIVILQDQAQITIQVLHIEIRTSPMYRVICISKPLRAVMVAINSSQQSRDCLDQGHVQGHTNEAPGKDCH